MKNITFVKISIGFAIALAILVVNILIADRNITKITENNQAEFYSARLSVILADTLLALKDAELVQREYILTGDYLALQSRQVQQIDRVQKLIRTIPAPSRNRSQQQQASQFKTAIELNIKELTSFKRQLVVPTNPELKLSPRERQIIPRIRQVIFDFDRAERLVVERARAESQVNLTNTRMTFMVSGLLGLIILSVLYGLVNWEQTKEQKIAAQLRDNAKDLEELYHQAPCGYHSLDEIGNITQMNRTELQMLGYEAVEIVGCKNLNDLLTPESREKFHKLLPIFKKVGLIQDLEFQMIRKDGGIVPVSATAKIVYDDRGNYLATRATVIDISDRIHSRQQERLSAVITQKIRASLELEQIFKTTVDGVYQLFEVDRALIFRLATDGSGVVIEERVSPSNLSVIGSKIFDPCFQTTYYDKYKHGRISAVSDIHTAGFQPCYIEFLQQFGVQATMTVPIHLRDELWGLLIVHHCRSSRLWQQQEIELMSQLANQIGIAISQSQSLAKERQQQAELVRSNTELNQFAYVCSHDLQEPLRMVTSYLQLLSNRYQGQLDADADDFIGYAVDGAVRMQALIQGLLGYARLSSRVQPFSMVECDRVLADATIDLQVAIRESGAIITSEPLPTVWGDPTQLTQLFENLIANGIKFHQATPPQIRIRVREIGGVVPVVQHSLGVDGSTTASDNLTMAPNLDLSSSTAWCFSVADNGIGIESEYLDRIFAIFQRLHSRETYPGTGIGLAICKKIVERHGGKIWAESTPKQGSTFYFIINSDRTALST